VDNQVAAPAETRTPNLHRANQSLNEKCGWKGGDSDDEKKPCPTKNTRTHLTRRLRGLSESNVVSMLQVGLQPSASQCTREER
jgi:hypothetical protein